MKLRLELLCLGREPRLLCRRLLVARSTALTQQHLLGWRDMLGLLLSGPVHLLLAKTLA